MGLRGKRGKERRTMKVYIVTSGSYSDYSIDAVFSTRKLAQEWIDKKAAEEYSGHYNIEPWDVDAQKDAKLVPRYRAESRRRQMVSSLCSRSGCRAEVLPPFRGRVIQGATAVPFYRGRKVIRVESTVSADHADKIAVEARQAWLRERGAEER
jgi:hypothetical protein